MKIELKKIRIDSRLSEETICFSADLYINGIKVGTASNRGQGGSTDYYAIAEHRDLLLQAEIWAMAQPPIELGEGFGTIPNDLEHIIDTAVEYEYAQMEYKRFQAKLQKSFKKMIVVGVPDATAYRTFQFSAPLESIFTMSGGIDFLKKQLSRIKADMKDGEQIMNTNLPEELKQYIATI